MIADKQTVRFFLSGYAKWSETSFVKVVYPDEHIHHMPAVDAIATDGCGRTIAIEHTILEPFPGQKESLHERLEKVFDPLKSRPVPGRNIMLTVPVNSVKRGQDWARLAATVVSWFEGVRASFPFGWSYHIIPIDLGINIAGRCVPMNGDHGVVSIMYSRPEMHKDFVDVVARSVERKVKKLIIAHADRRILLLQREWAAYSTARLRSVIISLTPQFPDILRVDEIWLADSWFYERYGYIDFVGVWPEGWASSAFFDSDTASG